MKRKRVPIICTYNHFCFLLKQRGYNVENIERIGNSREGYCYWLYDNDLCIGVLDVREELGGRGYGSLYYYS